MEQVLSQDQMWTLPEPFFTRDQGPPGEKCIRFQVEHYRTKVHATCHAARPLNEKRGENPTCKKWKL